MSQPAVFKKYSLVFGENDFTSPAATNPQDARKLKSLIPSISGELERERPAITAATIAAGSDPIRILHQFKHQTGGVFTIHYFAANSTTLWHATSVTGTWTSVLTTVAIPVFVNIDNTLHISDGTSSWIFDGTNYVKGGLALPPNAPAKTVTAGSGTPNIVLVNRYYWTTYEDKTSGRSTHEGSSSPISSATGAVANTGNVVVYQEPGTLTTSNASTAVVGVSTSFSSRHVGMYLYTSGQLQGTISAVTDATHLTLAANAATTVSGGHFIIAPVRATHWKIYASASEEDKVGLQLAEVAVTTVSYTDTSPMVGATGSIFVNVQRPMLNDPPNATKIMDVYQRRIWRRDEAFPSYYTYSAYEEVLAEQAGYNYECVPGVDPNTISPSIVNETSYPDQSAHLTCLRAHGDALFLGTENNTIPLFGQSLADFQMSQVNAFSLGMAGRHAAVSTPFGLVFLSYDKKVYLYPNQVSFFATTYGGDQTSSLPELGRPKRYEWETIDGSDFANAQMVFYNYGRRNWLAFAYKKTDATYATWVFDFEAKGWFQLQQGYTSIGVFEVTTGNRALFGTIVSGGNLVLKCIDDLTGSIAIPGGTNYPAGTYRFYTDFGQPGGYFLVKSIEYEKSDPTMEVDVTVWLDPSDPDNPGTGIPILMAQKRVGAKTGTATLSNRYSGSLNSDTGGTCQRLLVEFVVAASTVAGKLRGVAAYAAQLTDDPGH